MSTATAVDAGAAPKKGKKKLLVILIAAVVVLAAGGGGVLFMMKQKSAAAAAADDEEAAPAQNASSKRDTKVAPTFVPLDMFTVNLADREAERYAQVGITLEVADAKQGDVLKNFMPAIRNNILLLIAHKSAADLLGREGKDKLAREVQRETARALGYEIEADDEGDGADADAKPKKKKKRVADAGPVTAVHFSSFIIQ